MLYRLGKHFARFAVGQFFRKITISGEPASEEGPLLIVCNHQNSIVDPLLVVRCFHRELWFIAKSTYFNGKVISFVLGADEFGAGQTQARFPRRRCG